MNKKTVGANRHKIFLRVIYAELGIIVVCAVFVFFKYMNGVEHIERRVWQKMTTAFETAAERLAATPIPTQTPTAKPTAKPTAAPTNAPTSEPAAQEPIPLPVSYQIEGVPLISQFPELPRGCEVTSLAMLMSFNGKPADKMKLAREIVKEPITKVGADGKTYYGNPHKGFVGSMYNLSESGLGAYHEPIFLLLKNYFPRTALDLSGHSFDDVLSHVSSNHPVWVIITSTFSLLPNSEFDTWETENGNIDITYREHSVVITGYDEANVYFNDPSFGAANYAARADFQESWQQMGQQAVTVQ